MYGCSEPSFTYVFFTHQKLVSLVYVANVLLLVEVMDEVKVDQPLHSVTQLDGLNMSSNYLYAIGPGK